MMTLVAALSLVTTLVQGVPTPQAIATTPVSPAAVAVPVTPTAISPVMVSPMTPVAARAMVAPVFVTPTAMEQSTPADSLHRAGQAALNRGDYQKAVDTYRELRRRFPRSSRAGDGLYWEAFAL